MARTGATATPAADRVVKALGTGKIDPTWLDTTIARVSTDVQAGQVQALSTKTANYTATTTDRTLLGDATAASFTFLLPVAASNVGRVYAFKKIDATANTVTIDGNSTETIDGALTKVLAVQYASVVIQSDGTGWWIQ